MSKNSKKSTPRPNIAFVGKKDEREAPLQLTDGDNIITLPANQSKPFYHPDAKLIIRLYGWLYKPVVSK